MAMRQYVSELRIDEMSSADGSPSPIALSTIDIDSAIDSSAAAAVVFCMARCTSFIFFSQMKIALRIIFCVVVFRLLFFFALGN